MPEHRRQTGEIPARIEPEEVALYRFFDREGTLLYIGIAEEPAKRWYAHAHRSWWPTVVRYEVEWHPSRVAAEAAERNAVKTEQPRHNVQHNRPSRQLLPGLRKPGSPVLASIMLERFRDQIFTTLDVAKETGFSTTSARTTILALMACGQAVQVESVKGSPAPRYVLLDPLG